MTDPTAAYIAELEAQAALATALCELADEQHPTGPAPAWHRGQAPRFDAVCDHRGETVPVRTWWRSYATCDGLDWGVWIARDEYATADGLEHGQAHIGLDVAPNARFDADTAKAIGAALTAAATDLEP